MSALRDKKRKEAEEHIKQANKLMEKTMFRWAPDYLAAAPYLERAGDAFRAAGDFDRAKAVFAQAALVQNKNKSAFRAAQNSENAAKTAAQQIKETRATGATRAKYLAEMTKAYDSAAGYYGDMGELGKAADALLKAATAGEELGADGGDVRALYLRACSLMEAQGKPHFAVDVFRKTFTYLVKSGAYDESVALLARQVAIFEEIGQPNNVHKCYLSAIVLRLTMGDVAAADQEYMAQLQSDAFLTSDECALAEDLVRAFKTGNDELLQQTMRKQGFSFLDNQIGRLVRKLSLFGAGVAPVAPSAGRQPNPFAPREPTPAPAAAMAAAHPMSEYEMPPADVANEPPVEAKSKAKGKGNDDFDFGAIEFGGAPPAEPVAPASASSAAQQPVVNDDDMFDLT